MLRAILAGLGCVLISASALAAEAGRVVFVVGQAQVGARGAALDMPVQEGDALSTGADGYIYLKTVDDGFLILRPNSQAKISAYHIDRLNPANTRVKLELVKGVARSISGLGVKQARQNFRFNTPVAAIGVRGTDFIVYTNAQSSWVSVVSGGVVVSGFAGACGPEGAGPCEGGASRELFAGRTDAMLQVQRGQQVPQLLHNITVAPELNAPARSDEPVGKVTLGAKGGSAALDEVSLDPAKSGAPLLATPLVPIKPPKPPDVIVVTPPAPTPPPIVVVVPELPPVAAAPEILWGRWQAIADKPADTAVIGKIDAEASKVQVLIGSYVVARPNNSSFVLPTEGKASFVLAESEATLTRLGGVPMAAKVENAHLDIDFVSRSFSTGLSVVNTLGKVDMSSTGDVTLQGTLESSLYSPGFVVRGVLGGAKATEAAYSFKSTGTPDLSAAGFTRWSR
ncbi:MAG: FecR domain-containing protein [Pseudomonadota bacterium]|nr:FecR domain-containing protein [Pseudomonadota bacterium]